MLIKKVFPFTLFLFLFFLNSCVKEFIPKIEEAKDLLVVEGLITDQFKTNTIKLSKSLPFGTKSEAIPLSGCIVKISDDLGNTYSLKENKPGTYNTDSTIFKGIVGRFYSLKISIFNDKNFRNYESYPVEMKPVPPIDTIYYEKTVIENAYKNFAGIDGCKIYLDTHDPENKCRFYRWDFRETWKLRLNFEVQNQICWISNKSDNINIQSTVAFGEDRIKRNQITYISNSTDRLKTKYSILVNQYSMSEDEYIYWEKLQKITDQVGGLYDIIPASIPSNLRCIENPGEKVLGYFSVSANTSKRIFIKDNFNGIIDQYANCVTDTIYDKNPPGLNTNVWILLAHLCSIPCSAFYEVTTFRDCTDCTIRGSNIKPDFWKDDK